MVYIWYKLHHVTKLKRPRKAKRKPQNFWL